jgi:hypothetical protein
MGGHRAILIVRIADAAVPIHALARTIMTTTAPGPAAARRVVGAVVRQHRRPHAAAHHQGVAPSVHCTRKTPPRVVRVIPVAPHTADGLHRATRAIHRPEVEA